MSSVDLTSTSTSTTTTAGTSNMSTYVEKRYDHLTLLDGLVLAGYFLMVIGAGFYSMFRNKNRGTVSGYFLAGRYMTWLPVGASVFASNIGSEHFMGLAGSGAARGIGVGAFELNALFLLQIAAWVFVPVFIASGICTLPEYMSRRFGGKRIQSFLAVLSLIIYIFTKISVNLYSGAIFIHEAIGWNIYVSVISLLAITALCTVTGGLAAVMLTDTIQCFIMIVGGGLVALKAYIEVGGWEALQTKYYEARPKYIPENLTHCAQPSPDAFQLLRSWDDEDIPWPGFIFGQTWASLWYWCTDQVVIQRLLAAKSLSHAQGGSIFAGYLKILPLFLMIIPGMISRVLYPDEVACVDPDECEKFCQNRLGCSNTAYPRLVLGLMPAGLRGLMMAGMLAALMSGLASIFNSSSTMFTIDIWPKIRKMASEHELMIVGRVFVLVMVFLSILWIPVISSMQGGQLFIYIQAVSSYFAPPIATIVLMALMWKRLNEPGAFWGLIIGLVAGVLRMVLDVIFTQPPCGQIDTRPFLIREIHFMYFAIVLVVITGLTAIAISLSTEPCEEFRLVRTTFWTRFDASDRDDDRCSIELKPPCPGAIAVDITEDGTKIYDADEVMIEKNNGCARIWNWFCGMDSSDDAAEYGKTITYVDPQLNLELLKQTPREKLLLRLSLGVVVIIALFLCMFFTI